MGQGQFETDAEYAASQGLLYLDDLKSARFGTGQDFRIWYTGGNARLVCADGDIQFNHATSYDTAEGGETFDPDNQESMLHLEDDAGVKAYYNGDKKFETLSDGAKVTGTLQVDGDFKLLNDKKLICGYDDDLQIYHDTDGDDFSTIKNTTSSQLFIANNNKDIFIRADDGKDGVRLHPSGEDYKVELFHDDEVRLTTWSDGVFLDGGLWIKNYDADGWSGSSNHQKLYLGYDKDLQLYHEIVSGGDDYSTIKNTTATQLFIANNNKDIFIRADGGKDGIRLWPSGDDYKVGLFHDDTLKFETTSDGVECKEDLKLLNDKKIKVGYDDDLQIYHDTSPSLDASMIKNTTATELFIVNGGDESIFIRANEGKDGVRCWDSSESYKVGLFYDDTLKLETTNTGAKVTGDLVTTEDLKPDGHIELKNDKKLKVGYDDDLQIYHDTDGDDFSTIKNTTQKQFFIANNNSDIFIRANDGKDGVRLHPSGENYKVELFYNDSLRLETTNAGAKITGTLETTGAFEPDEIKLVNDKKIKIGYDDDLQIYHDTSPSPDASMIKNTTATELFITNSNESIFIRANEGKDGVRCWDSSENYKVGLFHDDDLRFETTSSGAYVHGNLTATGHLDIPDAGIIKLGTGDDMEVYHDGSNGYVRVRGTGNLFIVGSHPDDPGDGDTHIYIRAKSGQNSIVCYDDSNVVLYEDGDERFKTTDYGAYVTGRLNLSGSFSSDGGHVYAKEKVYAGRTHGGSYHSGKNYIQSYYTSSNYTYIAGENSNNSDHVFKCQIGGDTTIKFEAEGDAYWDGDGDSGGADYAEFFEWEDGNPSNQDRRGYPVILSNGKVRIATDSDPVSSIIGIISSVPAFIGNAAPNSWHGKFTRDEFGTFIREDEELLVWNTEDPQPNPDKPEELDRADNRVPVKDLDTADVPEWAKTNNLRRTRQVKVIDSTYDPNLIYQNRKDRKEWACVGLCGQIPLRKNQPAGDRWLKVKEMNTNLDMWLVRG